LGNVLDAVAQMADRAVGDQVSDSSDDDSGGGPVAHALSRDSVLPDAPEAAPGEAGAFERTSSSAPSSAPQASEHAVSPSGVATTALLTGDPLRGPEEKFERLGGTAAAPSLAAS